MPNLNLPLSINIRVIDIASDSEESVKKYDLRKVSVNVNEPVENERDIDKIKEMLEKQRAMLDKKWKSIQDLLIWAMNNKKEVVFVNVLDDKE
jgi:uncharacterized protein (DUF2344 family)